MPNKPAQTKEASTAKLTILKPTALYRPECNVAFVPKDNQYKKPEGIKGDVNIQIVGDQFQPVEGMTPEIQQGLLHNGILGAA